MHSHLHIYEYQTIVCVKMQSLLQWTYASFINAHCINSINLEQLARQYIYMLLSCTVQNKSHVFSSGIHPTILPFSSMQIDNWYLM